jgi:SAM-dependent methyltransferase
MLRPEGEPLWRRVAEVGEFAAGRDVLEVGTGSGEALCFWAAQYAIAGTGVDADPRRVQQAEEHARERSLGEQVQFQQAQLDDLPFRDGSFDAAVGAVAIGQLPNPLAAISELVRVVRAGGAVILLQWAWAPDISPAKRALVRHALGARARSPEEWQRHLTAEGVRGLTVHTVQDVAVDVPREALRARLGALPQTRRLRAWGRFAGMIRREREARRLLAGGNVLSVTLIKGTRWPS